MKRMSVIIFNSPNNNCVIFSALKGKLQSKILKNHKAIGKTLSVLSGDTPISIESSYIFSRLLKSCPEPFVFLSNPMKD